MSLSPRKWTSQELEADVAEATEVFRGARLDEPKEEYEAHFRTFSELFGELVDQLPALFSEHLDTHLMSAFVAGRERQKALRYLTAPPISEDDLKTLADATIGPLVFKRDNAAAERVRDVIRAVLDGHRFPWISESRDPTAVERDRAIVASAVLAAAREVETNRRSSSKDEQEAAVKALLASLNMTEVKRRDIPTLTSPSMPAPGEFCGESRVAGTRADVVARLWNADLMLIECKVSNSAVNSYKRIVHDTGGKAAHWYRALGTASTIPCAVLAGVFSRANLETVQNQMGVSLFWQHRLGDLADFVRKAR